MAKKGNSKNKKSNNTKAKNEVVKKEEKKSSKIEEKAEVKKVETKKVSKSELDKVKMGEGTTISANWDKDNNPDITVTTITKEQVKKSNNSSLIGIIICLAVLAIVAILIVVAVSIKNGNLKKKIDELNNEAKTENIIDENTEEESMKANLVIVSRLGNKENQKTNEYEVVEGKVITLESTQRNELKITVIEVTEDKVVIATNTSMSEGDGPIDLRAYNTKFEIYKGKDTILKTQTMNYGDSYTISIK